MKLASLIEHNLIITSLKARDRDGMLEEFADLIEAHRREGMRDASLSALKKREAQASTAMEKGVAVPHARMPEIEDFILAAGISREGIDCKAIDRKPSHLFFVMLAPPSKNTVLLHCLKAIAILTIDDRRREALLNARSAGEFHSVIEKSGVELKKYLSCGDIMQHTFDTLTPDMTIRDAVDLFAARHLEGVAVVDKGHRLLGEFTGRDLISLGLPKYMEKFHDVGFMPDFEPFEEFFRKEGELKVGDVFSRDVFSVKETDSVLRAAFHMVAKNRRRIYVTADDGRLIGIVNRFDLISKVLYV